MSIRAAFTAAILLAPAAFAGASALAAPQQSSQTDAAGAGDAQDDYIDPRAEARAHNEAFQAGIDINITPESVEDMLLCAAIWDRWHYAVESFADPAFTGTLRLELTSGNAARRKAYWKQAAQENYEKNGIDGDFNQIRADIESAADEIYAKYYENNDDAMESWMAGLGMCNQAANS